MTPALSVRRGIIFITTMWILIVIAALVLVLAKTMRVEAIASINRMSLAQAETAERGLEQYAIAAVNSEAMHPGSTRNWPMRKLRIGNAYAWLIRPDRDEDTAASFGLIDETAKVDINTFNVSQMLRLPGVTQEIVDSILNWRTPEALLSENSGADSTYYLSLPIPYRCKHSPFETTEELRLVKGIDNLLLYGADRNRDGRLSDSELSHASTVDLSNFGDESSRRGIFPFVTVYGVRASIQHVDEDGHPLIDLNNSDVTDLKACLNEQIGGAESSRILQMTQQKQPFRNVFDWAFRTGMTTDELSKVISRLTVNISPAHGKINVNTAPDQVLMCLPPLTQQDVQAIDAHRQIVALDADPSDISWLFDAVRRPVLSSVGSYLTGRSSCYSADIVVIAGNGRAFVRYRLVIDGSESPPRVIYRRNLSAFGWPLNPAIRDALRAGETLDGVSSVEAASN